MYDKPRYRRLQMKSRQKLFSDTSPELQMMHDNEEGEQKKELFKKTFSLILQRKEIFVVKTLLQCMQTKKTTFATLSFYL